MNEEGSGVCYCGSDMATHSAYDNHAPTEMPTYRDIPTQRKIVRISQSPVTEGEVTAALEAFKRSSELAWVDRADIRAALEAAREFRNN